MERNNLKKITGSRWFLPVVCAVSFVFGWWYLSITTCAPLGGDDEIINLQNYYYITHTPWWQVVLTHAKEILNQLAACQEGQITEGELTAAKEAIASSLRAVLDSPGAVESFHSTAALSGMIFTREEYLRAVEQVSVADVARCAKTLKLHSTYFLKGESL